MANNAATQQSLAHEPRFTLRLQNAMTKVAWEVLEEDASVEFHDKRVAYASRVNSMPEQMARQLALSFVNRPNIFLFETSYDFLVGATVTAAGDPDIESQLRSDWNTLAGADDVAITPANIPMMAPPPPLPRVN